MLTLSWALLEVEVLVCVFAKWRIYTQADEQLWIVGEIKANPKSKSVKDAPKIKKQCIQKC